MTLLFRGKIDRVDVDDTTFRAFVLDYKTGSATGFEALDRDPVAAGRHVQLALYSRAVRDNLGSDYTVGGSYWFVSSRGEFKRYALPPDRTSVDRRLDETLGLISQGIRSGAFPQVPGDPDRMSFKNCRYCDFDRVCPAGRDDRWHDKRGHPLAAVHGQLELTPGAGT